MNIPRTQKHERHRFPIGASVRAPAFALVGSGSLQPGREPGYASRPHNCALEPTRIDLAGDDVNQISFDVEDTRL